VILARLHRQPGLSQNELAQLCEVEPITIGRQIDKLEARGFLERRSDPTDRRIKRLHLLPAAASQFDDMGRMRDIVFEECFSVLTSQEREDLTNTLLKIKEKLSAKTASAQKLVAVEE
jgi:DNA-binding MarR family transcriptional regulator